MKIKNSVGVNYMPAFLITYDLREPWKDYANLYKAIRELGPHIHPLESIWVVVSDNTASEILQRLKPKIDANDGLLVVSAGNDKDHFGIKPETRDWVDKYL